MYWSTVLLFWLQPKVIWCWSDSITRKCDILLWYCTIVVLCYVIKCHLNNWTFLLPFTDYGLIEVPPAPETVATYDVNGPRLMITHIENENFKSYAGIQSLGPFHKVFNSSQNQSLPFNDCDYISWVFARQA